MALLGRPPNTLGICVVRARLTRFSTCSQPRPPQIARSGFNDRKSWFRPASGVADCHRRMRTRSPREICLPKPVWARRRRARNCGRRRPAPRAPRGSGRAAKSPRVSELSIRGGPRHPPERPPGPGVQVTQGHLPRWSGARAPAARCQRAGLGEGAEAPGAAQPTANEQVRKKQHRKTAGCWGACLECFPQQLWWGRWVGAETRSGPQACPDLRALSQGPEDQERALPIPDKAAHS